MVRSDSGKRMGVIYSQYSLREYVRRGSQSSRQKLFPLGSNYDFSRAKWPELLPCRKLMLQDGGSGRLQPQLVPFSAGVRNEALELHRLQAKREMQALAFVAAHGGAGQRARDEPLRVASNSESL